jgi:hypothetical protein
MFSKKKYFEVNREERHFGFLLFSELLNNNEFRSKIFNLINMRTGASLNPLNFEIYTEVAALRDYWNDLGNANINYEITHPKRNEVLKKILAFYKYEEIDINTQDVFWSTKDLEKRKLWCPSNWNIEEIKKLERVENDLVDIRWCFNAKPDLMLDCKDYVVFVELKVESGEGVNRYGYSQPRIQKKISELMKLLIPEYYGSTFLNTSLQLKSKDKGLNWNEVIELLDLHSRDNIGYKKVQNSLNKLLNYYQKIN